MRSLLSIIAIVTIFATTATAQAAARAKAYIAQYGEIAMKESAYSGVPASIILAQGLLESGFGASELTAKSNNHFGIKWKSEADGAYVEHMDDDKDANGNPIVSRFVKYASAEASFRHHSDFLKGRSPYRRLFSLATTDYKGWAMGLRECGYATDPAYGQKLITLIETYGLNQFDVTEVLVLEDDAKATRPAAKSADNDANVVFEVVVPTAKSVKNN